MAGDKDFRAHVLQIFYKRSNGNSAITINDFRVEREVGNDRRTEGTIQYLTDKGFLKPYTYASHHITHLGIDEVENNFPTLIPKENISLVREISHNEFKKEQQVLGTLPVIHGDYVVGDKVAGDKTSGDKSVNLKPGFIDKFWLQLIVGVIVVVVGFVITEGKLPRLLSKTNSLETHQSENISTTTPSLNVIFEKTNSLSTSLERQEFIKNYKDTDIYGTGMITDISRSESGYVVQVIVSKNLVACNFGFDFEKEVLLMKPEQAVSFTGVFTTGSWGFGSPAPWYIKACKQIN